MIEIHYTPAGKRVFVCYPVTELEIVVCPLGDDCLGDGPTCIAVARALAEGHTQGSYPCPVGFACSGCTYCETVRETLPLSRSDESATLPSPSLPYLFRFPCLPVFIDPDMEPGAVEVRRVVDFTADAQARLLTSLLRKPAVYEALLNLPVRELSDDEWTLLASMCSLRGTTLGATIGRT